jgi:hypothetical protein
MNQIYHAYCSKSVDIHQSIQDGVEYVHREDFIHNDSTFFPDQIFLFRPLRGLQLCQLLEEIVKQWKV